MPKKSKKTATEGGENVENKPSSANKEKKISKKMAQLALALSSDEENDSDQAPKEQLQQSKKGELLNTMIYIFILW